MKLKLLLAVWAGAMAIAFTSLAEECSPLHGVVYYTHPLTGVFRLYFSFELVPDHLYQIDITSDGKTYQTLQLRDTTGNTHEIYESFSVSPCEGLWPRVIDLGPTT